MFLIGQQVDKYLKAPKNGEKHITIQTQYKSVSESPAYTLMFNHFDHSQDIYYEGHSQRLIRRKQVAQSRTRGEE
jgi:hypothetical protein